MKDIIWLSPSLAAGAIAARLVVFFERRSQIRSRRGQGYWRERSRVSGDSPSRQERGRLMTALDAVKTRERNRRYRTGTRRNEPQFRRQKPW
jgi:hypothetical protein